LYSLYVWFTVAFLHKHGYECKNSAVVSVKRHPLQGDFVPLTPGPGALSLDPTGGKHPDPTVAPTSLPEVLLTQSVK